MLSVKTEHWQILTIHRACDTCQVAYCLKEEKHFHGQRSTYPIKLEKIAKNNQFI